MKTDNNNKPLLAFVDEIGDRGYSKKSSEYFAMSAVIFPTSTHQKVKDCITKIKTEFGVPLHAALHWRKHCRMHEYRKFAAMEVSKLENLTVIFVISDKKTVPHDHTQFYNIVAAFTLERILKHTEKLGTTTSVRFGHVRGFDHSISLNYFKNRNWQSNNYHRLYEQPKWIPAVSNSGIQIADIYSGILGAAMLQDRFGNFEHSYLETIKHQIRKSSQGQISGYGIKAISLNNDPESFKWWPEGWK